MLEDVYKENCDISANIAHIIQEKDKEIEELNDKIGHLLDEKAQLSKIIDMQSEVIKDYENRK